MADRKQVQEDALAVAMQHTRCGLGISMGVGKTRIAIQHLQRYYDPFVEALVVIPKRSVAKSWTDELEKMGLQDLAKHITFTTYLSINKHDPMKYQLLYLDECHSLLNNHRPFLTAFSGRILGLTGTPPVRKGTEKYEMVNKYCPIKYTFTVDDATDSKILNDYKIIVHELLLSKTPTHKKKNKKGGFWYT